VGRPPQELMWGWGRPPICKASRADHRLGFVATRNLAEEGKKGSVVWSGGGLRKNAEMRVENLKSEEGLKEKCEL
jgi:hypothetical protein